MKVLLDTRAFLWWITDDQRLSRRARDSILDTTNDVFFSVASAWEIVIKASLGRVELPGDPEEYRAQAMAEGMTLLSGDQQIVRYPVEVIW